MKIEPGPGDFFMVRGNNLFILNYLKASIPQAYRYYNADENAWLVHKDHVLPVVQLGYTQFGAVDCSALDEDLQVEIAANKASWKPGYKRTKVFKKEKCTLDEAYATLHLRTGAPRLIVDAVWKALAHQHHPDRGGDEEVFKQILEAYTKIKEAY